MLNKYAIMEGYNDGSTWTHYFHDEVTARWNLEALREAHPFREYLPIGFEETSA